MIFFKARHFNIFYIGLLAILISACGKESEIKTESNIFYISEFGIYLVSPDTLDYNVVIADSSGINVYSDPLIGLEDINYYDVSSNTLRLNKDIEGFEYDSRTYVMISDGEILSIGTFWTTPNCCYPGSDNFLVPVLFVNYKNMVAISKGQQDLFMNTLPEDKLGMDLNIDIKEVVLADPKSLQVKIELTNNTAESLYLLDPEKVPDLHKKGHSSDIYFDNSSSLLAQYPIWPGKISHTQENVTIKME